jgi:DNA invertase Pin-like site-specific DNA recombinase
LREALAACRSGDTLVVTKLDRLARSLTDARNIVEELTEAGVKLNIGGSLHDPTDPVGRLLFNVLGMIAEFESDLIRSRTKEGMKVAKAKGRLRGKQPKLKPAKEAHLVELWRAGKHTSAELAELFSVARSTVLPRRAARWRAQAGAGSSRASAACAPWSSTSPPLVTTCSSSSRITRCRGGTSNQGPDLLRR